MKGKAGIMSNKVMVQLFGNFQLTSEKTSLGEGTLHSNKLTKVLAFIVINRDSVLTHQRLVDTFWEDNSRNPVGALKNLMYRVRNELKALGDEQFIITLPGAYQWNPEIKVESDYEQFEKNIDKLRTVESEEEKKQLCRAVISCYRGNISAVISDEFWLLPKVIWYRSMYMDTVKKLCEILDKEKNWVELEDVCNHALTVDSLDEDINCWLIRGLQGQKKYELAMFQYEKANKLFYENMGIRRSEKLHSAFRQMASERAENVPDIQSLLEELKETEHTKGVFFCDYQIFRQIYRIEARRIERLGVAEHLLLLTVRRNSKLWEQSAADRGLMEGAEILEQAIRASLRTGDIATRYSSHQFVVLLPTCTYESSIKVASRILKNFQKNIGGRHIELDYELEELTAEI